MNNIQTKAEQIAFKHLPLNHHSHKAKLTNDIVNLAAFAEELGRLKGIRDTYRNYSSLAPDEMRDRITNMDKAINKHMGTS